MHVTSAIAKPLPVFNHSGYLGGNSTSEVVATKQPVFPLFTWNNLSQEGAEMMRKSTKVYKEGTSWETLSRPLLRKAAKERGLRIDCRITVPDLRKLLADTDRANATKQTDETVETGKEGKQEADDGANLDDHMEQFQYPGEGKKLHDEEEDELMKLLAEAEEGGDRLKMCESAETLIDFLATINEIITANDRGIRSSSEAIS